MGYRIILAKDVVKTLDRLDRTTNERIKAKLRAIAEEPLDPRLSKTLKGIEGLRSSRVGGWRIIFTVDDETKAIYVLRISPRGQAYRDL